MHNAHLPVEQVTSIEHAHVREEMAVNMFTRGLTHSSPLCRSQIGSNQPVICPPRRGKQASLIQERWRDLEFRQRNRPLIQERRRYLEFRQRSGPLIRERRRDLEFRQRSRPLIQKRRRDLEFRQRNRPLIQERRSVSPRADLKGAQV
jgi:hypothetical protein